ncbi:MAG: putative maltokinase [Bacteroidota bacterium]
MLESVAIKGRQLETMDITDWTQLDNFVFTLAERILPSYLPKCRWFRSKTKAIDDIKIHNYPSLPSYETSSEQQSAYLLCLEVTYIDASQESYFLPITLVRDQQRLLNFSQIQPQAIICKVLSGGEEVALVDAIYDVNFRKTLFQSVRDTIQVSNEKGTIRCETGSMLKADQIAKADITSKVLNADQSNTAIIYNDQYFLKIYRKLEYGLNPDLEIVRFLSEHTTFDNSPKYGGSLVFLSTGKRPIIIGLIQNKIINKGDAWETVLKDLSDYYQRVLSVGEESLPKLVHKDRLYYMDIPHRFRPIFSRATYKRVTLLAQRTAEMHIALASDQETEGFTPVLFRPKDRAALYEGQAHLVKDQLQALQQGLTMFPEEIAQEAQKVIAAEARILKILEEIASRPIDATQTRVHGDYHLGQVLDSGEDFYIIDFEGEPLRDIEERRYKTSPFKDVAGMIRSFHYAAYGELYLHAAKYNKAQLAQLEDWAAVWFHYASRCFLTAYFDRAEGQDFIPKNKTQLSLLLRTFILEKAIYELGYEMNARPDWLKIPLRGVLYELG